MIGFCWNGQNREGDPPLARQHQYLEVQDVQRGITGQKYISWLPLPYWLLTWIALYRELTCTVWIPLVVIYCFLLVF